MSPDQRGGPRPQYGDGQQYDANGQQYGQQYNGNAGYNNDGGYGQAQPSYSAPPYSYHPPQSQDEKYSFDQAFQIDKPKYNDVWAGILFLLVSAGFVVVSALAIRGYITGAHGTGLNPKNNDFTLNSNSIILFACCLLLALVLSYGYVWLARLIPKQFIWITGILNVVWAFGTAIYYLYEKVYAAGIVFLIFAVFLTFAFYTWIPRIPFSALMLKTSIDVSKKHGHVYLVSFIGGLFATALGAWFSVTLVAIYVTYEPSTRSPHCEMDGTGCSRATVIGLIAYATFAMYWMSEFLKNTIHTIISGVYGAWYFSPHNFPKGATRGAAKRTLTYSFGSVSLGSLLVAIVQFLKQICSIARSQGASEGGIAGLIQTIVFCILGCILGLLEWVLEFVNRYAFAHIALYGKSYVAAAKDTWKMIKDRGVDALINVSAIPVPNLLPSHLFVNVNI